MRIAILGGTAGLGFGLAVRFCKAGLDVIIGSRSAEKAIDATKKVKEMLGENIKIDGMVNELAAKEADIIILSVPLVGLIQILKAISDSVAGKVVISPVVPLEIEAIGGSLRPIRLWSGSVAELVAERLKNSKVASAFHNVSEESLLDYNEPVDCDVVVCSDHEDAKRVTMELAEKIDGVRAIDGGPLSNSRYVEEFTSFLIFLNRRYSSKKAGIRICGINLQKSF